MENRQRNKKTFVQNEINQIIQEDLEFLGIKMNIKREGNEPNQPLLFIGGSKTNEKKLIEMIGILMLKEKSENKLQNLESRFERQNLAAGR